MQNCHCSAQTIQQEGISLFGDSYTCNACNLPVDELIYLGLQKHDLQNKNVDNSNLPIPDCSCADEILLDWGISQSKFGMKCNFCFYHIGVERLAFINSKSQMTREQKKKNLFEFCPMCGVKLLDLSGLFCHSCGQRFNTSRSAPMVETLDLLPEQSDYSRLGRNFTLFLLWLFGFSIVSLSIQTLSKLQNMEYVTFDITLKNLFNGGWVIYYWGPAAFVAQDAVSAGFVDGMYTSDFQNLMLIILAIGFLLMLPALIRIFDFVRFR